MRCRTVLALTLLMVLTAQLAAAQTTAVRFGRLWDGSRIITDGVVVVDGDRAIEGDPTRNIDALFTSVRWVMKNGRIVVDKR